MESHAVVDDGDEAGAQVDNGRDVGVHHVDSGPDGVGAGLCLRRGFDVEQGAAGGPGIAVHAHSRCHNSGVCAAAAPAECLVERGVLVRQLARMRAVGGDDLPLEDIIGAQAVQLRQGQGAAAR